MTTHTLKVERFGHGNHSTIGTLSVDGTFCCFTCEDEMRETKVAGQTRIPEGRYQLKLRTEDSPMNTRYRNKFGEYFHKGMLWLQDVPDFTYVYIHIGNHHTNTEGCLLVGWGVESDVVEGGGHVTNSTSAYKVLYETVIGWLDNEDEVWVEIVSR